MEHDVKQGLEKASEGAKHTLSGWVAAVGLAERWVARSERVDALLEGLATGLTGQERARAQHLFSGVVNHYDTLENHIKQHIDRPMEELSPVEYGALLIAAFELAQDISVPFKVAINEAVELAKVFGGTDGHKYVNGVLDKLAQQLRPHEMPR